MNLSKKKVFVVSVFMSIVLVCCTAFASSYVGNYEFARELYVGGGKGNHFIIGDKLTVITRVSKQTNAKQASSDYFYVDVLGSVFGGYEVIATFKMKRNGETKKTLTNVNGNLFYKLKLRKANDGCKLKGSVEVIY